MKKSNNKEKSKRSTDTNPNYVLFLADLYNFAVHQTYLRLFGTPPQDEEKMKLIYRLLSKEVHLNDLENFILKQHKGNEEPAKNKEPAKKESLKSSGKTLPNDEKDNNDRFSKSGKYDPNTPWGATYQSIINDGFSHELAVAWADGMHGSSSK